MTLKTTMNKSVKLLILILVITLPLALVSCGGVTDTPKTAEEQLSLLLNTLQGSAQKVEGALHYNNQENTVFCGTIDKAALTMDIKVNDTTYLYASRVLLKSVGTHFTVENPNTVLKEQKNLLPFNLMYFSYSEKNSDSIYMTGSTINISFVGKGAKLSFDSDKNVNDGILSIHFKNDTIKSAVFTAEENNTKLTVYYRYEKVPPSLDKPPKVFPIPNDTVSYAQYAISTFAKKYSEQTIHTKSGFDTEAKISDIIVEESKIKSVTSVDITDQNMYFTLTINYHNKEPIYNVGSAITTITIAYNIDYDISNIRINTTDYILK